MGKRDDSTVIPRATLHTFIAQVRSDGHHETATEFDEMEGRADTVSKDLAADFIRIRRDHLIAMLGAFYVDYDEDGTRAIMDWATELGLFLDEDDVALARNTTARLRWANNKSESQVSPDATTTTLTIYKHLLVGALALSEGDIDSFCEGKDTKRALQSYVDLYALLKVAEAKAWVNMDYVFTIERIKILLAQALKEAEVPLAFYYVDFT